MKKCIVCNKFKATEVCDKCGDPLCEKCLVRLQDLVLCDICAMIADVVLMESDHWEYIRMLWEDKNGQ